jgi:hypothetical protein
MGKDLFSNRNSIVSADDGYAIIPSDANELDVYTRGIYVGVSGDVKVQMVKSGDALLFKNVQAGTLLPIRVKKVYSTDTTATNIIALY